MNAYDLAIVNCQRYLTSLTSSDRNSGDCYNAFELSGTLAIIFGREKEAVIHDILHRKICSTPNHHNDIPRNDPLSNIAALLDSLGLKWNYGIHPNHLFTKVIRLEIGEEAFNIEVTEKV